jgi:hypothetical protein
VDLVPCPTVQYETKRLFYCFIDFCCVSFCYCVGTVSLTQLVTKKGATIAIYNDAKKGSLTVTLLFCFLCVYIMLFAFKLVFFFVFRNLID